VFHAVRSLPSAFQRSTSGLDAARGYLRRPVLEPVVAVRFVNTGDLTGGASSRDPLESALTVKNRAPKDNKWVARRVRFERLVGGASRQGVCRGALVLGVTKASLLIVTPTANRSAGGAHRVR
jgi:hypothetical protein